MKSITVSPKAAADSAASASSSARPTRALTEEARALCARLPPLPPFAGGSEFAHNDPLLFAAPLTDAPSGATGSTGSQAGYDFVFPSAPDADLMCVICSLVCRDAVETTCSHIFCSQCLSTWMERKRECVTCRTPLPSPSDVRASGFIRRKVLGLIVACPHADAGGGGGGGGLCCEWQGEIRYLSSHLRRDCEMQRMHAAAEAFIQAKPDRYASVAEWGDAASAAASSPSSTSAASSSDAIAVAASALFPPALLDGLSLGALYRLASSLAVHAPLQGERCPHAHLANSTPLWNHWIATRASQPQGDAVDLMAVEPHVCNKQCIRPPVPGAAWIEGRHEAQDELQARSVRSWILSTLVAARRQFLRVYSACFLHLQSCPVRVLSAFLSAKGLSDAASFRGPAGQGVEKIEMVEACMAHRTLHDVHAADARSKPSAASSSHAGFGAAAAAPPSSGVDGAALLHHLQGVLQGSGVFLDPAAFGGHLSAHAAMHGAMSGAGAGGGGQGASDAHFDHHMQHLSAWGLAAAQQQHGQAGMGINVQTLGNGGVVVSMHMGSAPQPQQQQPANYQSPLHAHDGASAPPADASAALAQAMLAHAAQHRLAAEARLAELEQNRQAEAEEAPVQPSASMRRQESRSSVQQQSQPQPQPALMFQPRRPAQYSHVPPAATARQASRPRAQQRQQQQQQQPPPPMENEPAPPAGGACCGIM